MRTILRHPLSLTPWLLFASMAALLTLLALSTLATPDDKARAQAFVPAAPTGLEASEISHDRVVLTWDDPGDNSITGYQVLRRSVDGDEYGDGKGPAEFVPVVEDTGSAAATYADTSVTPRTRYVYRVKARNAAGLSWQSPYLNVWTPEIQSPSNSPPRFSGATAARSVPENSAASTAVGAPVAATDPDNDDLAYSLSGDAAGSFTIDSGGQLSVADGSVLDHETGPDLSLTVTASDPDGAGASMEVAITVTDVWDPNVLLIVADDVGAGVFGAYGSTRYSTPRIDEIAAAGVRFANAHANPCCTGSRLELMTGKSNVRNYRGAGELPASEYTFLDLMDSGGYRTGAAGKWKLHGGQDATGTQPEDKLQTYCLWGTRNAETESGISWPRYWGSWVDCDGEVTRLSLNEYGPDLHVNFLLDFIAANRNRPFLAYYPMMLAHAPVVAPPVTTCSRGADNQCHYEDMVSYMDRSVGLLYDKLSELEILDNTVLLFTSDNSTRYDLFLDVNGAAVPGEKATTLDVSTHVPLIVHAPGVEGGRVLEDLVSLTDLLPTLADATGLAIPDRDHLDGVSFWQRLRGDGGSPREWLYTYYFPQPYVSVFDGPRAHPQAAWTRNIRYKLYDNGDLFDVLADPNEVRPLPQEDTASAPARAALQAALDSMPDRAQAIDWDRVVGRTKDIRPRWRPVFVSASVTEGELTLNYAGHLYSKVVPANGSYTVHVDDVERSVTGVAVRRNSVTLDLASPVTPGQKVTVSYEPGANGLEHVLSPHFVEGRAHWAGSIDAAEVSNDTQPNSPAIGAPVISGLARTSATLSADVSGISDPDGLTGASYLYQWIRTDGTTDTDIDGATQASYVVAAADEGNSIMVRVSFSDDDGSPETLLSEATVPVRPNFPATGAPVIVGRAQVDEPLLADTSGIDDADGLTNPGFTYQWLVEDAEIPEATGSGFVPAAGHQGRTLRVRVFHTDDAGYDETLTSEPTPAVRQANIPATGLPSIAGAPRVGEVQSADTSGIADADGMNRAVLGYQWLSNGRGVPGATGSSYTLAFADEGKSVQVRVSFTDDAGNREALTSQAVRVETQPPGQPGELAATAGNGSVALRWRAPVDAHKVSAYRILRHRPEQGEPEPLVHVAFTGTGATAYTDTAVAPGVLYEYRVQASDYLGVLGPASDPVSVRVPGANNAATGQPAITGTAQAGETLTADTSGISDADGMTSSAFTYQWLRVTGGSDAEIDEATAATYTVADDDVGNSLKVRVSFTDDDGNDESLTSAAVAVPAPDPLTGAFDGSTVPASHDGSSSFTFQLYFSEEPRLGYANVRDHVLTVTNGEVTKAERVNSGDNTGSPATSYTDTTVAAGTRYAYRVIALNASGASPRSGYVNVTTGDAP